MSASPIDLVIDRAAPHGLRRAGKGRWRMRGACHGGRNPNAVSIAEGDSGAVLLKCWTRGCDAETIAAALGLQLEDLFPRTATPHGTGRPRAARPFTTRDLLTAFKSELRLVWLVLADVESGRELNAADRRRAGTARERCQALIEELDLA